ncbi:ABC transporter permease subunit [Dongia sp.]|uniref:ABC transporter permease subunit n=1 Tax=Dongia sp. TaxID=1977262 RepID=UPI0035B2FEF7
MIAKGSDLPNAPRGIFLQVAGIALLLQAIALMVPLAGAGWLSLQAESDGALSFTAWTRLAGSPEARAALFNSLLLAAVTAVATVLLGIPLAFAVLRARRWLGRLLLAVILILCFADPGIRILGWMLVFKDLIASGTLPLLLGGGFIAECIAATHAWLPLATIILLAGFARVDQVVLDAARECGATAFTLLRRILLPQSWFVAGFAAAVTFCGSLGSFLEPRLLGTVDDQQASEWLQRALESETGWPYAATMLLLMLVLSVLPLLGLLFLRARKVMA